MVMQWQLVVKANLKIIWDGCVVFTIMKDYIMRFMPNSIIKV